MSEEKTTETKKPYTPRKSYSSSKNNRAPRKKVCPFILDKELSLDFKNLKVIYRFVTETGKIVPRRVSGVTAKNQRKLTKQIKRARALGLIAPKMETV